MKLTYSSHFKNDLIRIQNYISQDSIENANKFIQKVFKCIEQVEKSPFIGTYLNNKIKADLKYRYRLLSSYIIIYQVKENEIIIETILHQKRDFRKLRFN